MRIGILGGTGPAGRGLAVRLAGVGDEIVIGSRDAERAATIAKGLVEAWPAHSLSISGTSNEKTAAADVVVIATPWDSATATVKPLFPPISSRRMMLSRASYP